MIAGAALELLYPSSIYCVSCGNLIDATRPYALCDECAAGLRWADGPVCGSCGKILAEDARDGLCSDCSGASRPFERGFACMEYGGGRELIHNFKYRGRAYCGEKIAEMMHDRLRLGMPETDMVLPVPMHRGKERKRGYNQADVVGRLLARRLGLPYRKGLLVRTRATAPMSKLGGERRRENLKGAFALRPGGEALVEGRRLLLVDDVFTTGSTVEACAEALLAAGAAAVCFVVAAASADIPAE
ncbi:MAG: ComF family protein [Clostridiales Family XIII bacterium]|nr:ComF family protein [Clostridiales Family XIII bacterium]